MQVDGNLVGKGGVRFCILLDRRRCGIRWSYEERKREINGKKRKTLSLAENCYGIILFRRIALRFRDLGKCIV